MKLTLPIPTEDIPANPPIVPRPKGVAVISDFWERNMETMTYTYYTLSLPARFLLMPTAKHHNSADGIKYSHFNDSKSSCTFVSF